MSDLHVLQEKVQDLIDCVQQVDVSVVPEYTQEELWTLCSKAVRKGPRFYHDAMENPSLLNDLVHEPLEEPIPMVPLCSKPSMLRAFLGNITNLVLAPKQTQ